MEQGLKLSHLRERGIKEGDNEGGKQGGKVTASDKRNEDEKRLIIKLVEV